MSGTAPTSNRLRFDNFEFDLRTGEVWRNGVRVRLQDQPFQVLRVLLERCGEIVTREELKQTLWPADTFVDFDDGLNTAVKKIRDLLCDSAEGPRYIETIPRRGYRFIAPVQNASAKAGELEPAGPLPVTSERTVRFTSAKRLALLSPLLGLLVLAAVVLWLNLRSALSIPAVVDSVQITRDGLPKVVIADAPAEASLLSDGTRLYFQEFLAGRTVIVQVSTQGGETARMPLSLQDPVAYDISSTRSELLVGGGAFNALNPERSLWVVPLPAGPPHRVGDILAHYACWAPDGLHLVYLNDKDVFVAKPDGSEVRRLATADGFTVLIRFSPDGTRLRFNSLGSGSPPGQWDIFEIGVDGSGLRRLSIHGSSGTWSADGKYYFYQTDRDIWVLPERRSIGGKVELGSPVQLTAGPVAFSVPVVSADRQQLFVVGNQQRVELVHYDSKSNQFAPFMGGISAGELEVSPDGQWVAYTTYPESNLWRSKLDGSERLQLTFAPLNAHEPRWSPDGKQILFADVPSKIFVVPAEGGIPRQLMPEDHPTLIGAGAWQPDGNSIVFVRDIGCRDQDPSCWRAKAAIYVLDLKTQQVSKLPGSDKMFASRVSRNGRYMTAQRTDQNGLMLYDFQTQEWSGLAQGSFGGVTWSHDSKFAYADLRQGAQSAELVRISVPDGKVQRILDLTGVTLGGFWTDWISLLPDDSPLLMLDRSTEEIYRLDLQYR